MANLNMKLRRLKDREGIRSCKATLCSKEIDTDGFSRKRLCREAF